jgi:hypothetical protein
MKKTLIAMALLLASIAHAEDITAEQLNELYRQNVEAYKTVTVGMSAQYLDYTLDSKEWCYRRRNEVVVDVIPNSEYHVKITTTIANNDCGGTPEGSTFVEYEWREIKDLEVEENSYRTFERVGKIVSFVKIESDENRRVTILRKKIDVTQSQFYNRHQYRYFADNVENGSSLTFRDGKIALEL